MTYLLYWTKKGFSVFCPFLRPWFSSLDQFTHRVTSSQMLGLFVSSEDTQALSWVKTTRTRVLALALVLVLYVAALMNGGGGRGQRWFRRDFIIWNDTWWVFVFVVVVVFRYGDVLVCLTLYWLIGTPDCVCRALCFQSRASAREQQHF